MKFRCFLFIVLTLMTQAFGLSDYTKLCPDIKPEMKPELKPEKGVRDISIASEENNNWLPKDK